MRFLLAPLAFLAACSSAPPIEAQPTEPATASWQLVRSYPHDPKAFTQGLFYLGGHLYESTGHYGQSTLRKVRLEDGTVLQSVDLPPSVFGEGIVNWGQEILGVTWQNQTGYRWDLATFRKLGEFSYPGEGWGLTQDGTNIILSDGTPTLRFLDPATMEERRRVTVTSAGQPLRDLNELEFVRGEILANVWQTDLIARIDPASGQVKGWIDLSRLAATLPGRGRDDVLNGIAYDAPTGRLFVTGKNWPKLFEIRLG